MDALDRVVVLIFQKAMLAMRVLDNGEWQLVVPF